MMKFSGLKILAIGCAALTGSAASATNFTFTLTKSNQSAAEYQSLPFTATQGSATLAMSVYGAHLNDTKVSSGSALYSVSAAKVATWTNYGMGVLFDNGSAKDDNESDGTHQIDNVGGGVDFVVLSFNQAVTLTGYGLKAYSLGGSTTDSDSAFMAYNGTLSTLQSGLDKNLFTSVSGSGGVNNVTTGSSATSAIWLIGAAVGSDRDDAFKLTSLSFSATVQPPSSSTVPEPATWAMMLVGFGAIGGTMRSRRTRANLNVTFG